MLSGNWDKLVTVVKDKIYYQDFWQLSMVTGTYKCSPQGSDQTTGLRGGGLPLRSPEHLQVL